MCNSTNGISEKLSLYFYDSIKNFGNLKLKELETLEAVGEFIGSIESLPDKDFSEDVRELAFPAVFSDSVYDLLDYIQNGQIAGPFESPDQGFEVAVSYQSENGKRWLCQNFNTTQDALNKFTEALENTASVVSFIEDDLKDACVPDDIIDQVKDTLGKHKLEAALITSVLDVELVRDFFLYFDRFASLLEDHRLVINGDPEDADVIIPTPAGTICGYGIFKRP